jgi:hypothetical protein
MPRFVILEHDHPALHWDFMLEAGPVLRTWRLAAPPQSAQAVRATASFNHRLHYLDYEGPLSGDRGSVRRWDAGTFSWQCDLQERVVVDLVGLELRGVAVLEHVDADEWTLVVRSTEPPL